MTSASMPRYSLSAKDIQERLDILFSGKVTIDATTLVDTATKAIFVDAEYGVWSAYPNKVMRGTRHPARAQAEKDYHKSAAKAAAKTRISPDEVKAKVAAVHGDLVSIVGTYVSMRHKLLCHDRDFGEFTTTVMRLLRGQSHPARVKMKKAETCRGRFGGPSPMSSPEIRARATETLTSHYGCDNYTKTKEYSDRMIAIGKKKVLPWGETLTDFFASLGLPFSRGTVYKWIRLSNLSDRQEMVDYLKDINSGCVSENKCRKIIENLTGKTFVKVRVGYPRKFELDGYCDELKLAFEYDGYQHFRKAWYDTDTAFEKRVSRDRAREVVCLDMDVHLIRIPYDANNLESFIEEKIEEWRKSSQKNY
jgi:hypothetical protein